MNTNLHFDNVKDLISFIQVQRKFVTNTSLEKMKYLSSLFGNPHEKIKAIHVGGTNGKGSTVAILASIYRTAGLNVGTFTSPYIVSFNERIQYNGVFISDECLLKYGNLILEKYPILESQGFDTPTFFEFITMVGFLFFSELKDLDLVIMEVGMGGRLDATNIITPLVSVITNISYDHMEQLGNTLELICSEKLGIVKANVPLVTSINNSDLQDLIINKTNSTNSPLIKVDLQRLTIKEASIYQSVFSYKSFDNIITSNLLGYHQMENISLCIEVVEYCNNHYDFGKRHFTVSNELLIEGIKNAKWPGRFERVSNSPCIYVDGGHNIDCINRICEFIGKQNIPYKRAVVAISKDKAVSEMIQLIDQSFDEIIFTNYSYSRSDDPIHLYDLSNCNNKKMMNDLDSVIDYCYQNQCDFTLFIGSLYLISDVRNKIINKKN